MDDLKIGVLTVSNECALLGQDDEIGKSLVEACEDRGWLVVSYHVTACEDEAVAASLIEICDADEADVVLTVGGTGIRHADVTPEVTSRMCERLVPGVAETMRCPLRDDDAHLSLWRGVAGVRGNTLIVNLPGEQSRALGSFAVVSTVLPEAVAQLREARCT